MGKAGTDLGQLALAMCESPQLWSKKERGPVEALGRNHFCASVLHVLRMSLSLS